MDGEGKCPVVGGGREHQRTVMLSMSNQHWWPNQLKVKVLHQHSPLSDPMGPKFNYAEEFKTLDLDAVVGDLHALMTDVAGLVAGGLRALRPVLHPHGLA